MFGVGLEENGLGGEIPQNSCSIMSFVNSQKRSLVEVSPEVNLENEAVQVVADDIVLRRYLNSLSIGAHRNEIQTHFFLLGTGEADALSAAFRSVGRRNDLTLPDVFVDLT